MYLNVLTRYLHPEENKVIGFLQDWCALAGGKLAMPHSPRAVFTLAIPLKCRAEVFIQSWSLPALGNERQQECTALLSGKRSCFVSRWKSLVYHTLK